MDISERKTRRENRRQIITAHKNNTSPAATVAELVNTIGYPAALVTVAELVNGVGDWDKRISTRSRTWAAKITEAATHEELEAASIYTPGEIHSCHIDQIAAAMQEYDPGLWRNSHPEAMSEEPAATFPTLTEKVNAHHDSEKASFAAKLETVTAYDVHNSWWYRDHLTAAAAKMLEALQDGDTLTDTIKQKMLSRFNREQEKKRRKDLAKLEAAAKCEPLASVIFNVEWTRSRTWGNNPTAEIIASDAHYRTTRTGGHASGCGYDKESAAIASGCNVNPQFMRLLYDHAERGGAFSYSIYTGKNGLPWIDGGCGVSCWRSVFEDCGFTFQDVFHGKTADSYIAQRKEG